MSPHHQGQALVEFSLSAGLIALTLAGAGWLLQTEWNRARCAYLVFQKGHARLTGRLEGSTPSRLVSIEDRPATIEASGRCGKIRESVSLPKLEIEGASP